MARQDHHHKIIGSDLCATTIRVVHVVFYTCTSMNTTKIAFFHNVNCGKQPGIFTNMR
jgi:hypothetical protein